MLTVDIKHFSFTAPRSHQRLSVYHDKNTFVSGGAVMSLVRMRPLSELTSWSTALLNRAALQQADLSVLASVIWSLHVLVTYSPVHIPKRLHKQTPLCAAAGK